MGYLLLSLIAAVGLAASVVCHALGWLGVTPPGGKAVMGLHIGIFFVWIPLVILANRTMPPGVGGNADHLLAELPRWAKAAVGGLFVWAIANFILFLIATRSYPKGQEPFALVLRGFSGHWMMFYGVATAGYVGLRRLTRRSSEPIDPTQVPPG